MLLLSLTMTTSLVEAAAAKQGEPVEWQKHPYDEQEYYKGIPDIINMTDARVTFHLSHWFLVGVQRGLYNDAKMTLNDQCFGEYYVTKLNEYSYTFTNNPFGNVFDNAFPELYLTYMFFYMLTNTCGLDHTFNDFSTYCWYRGCWPMQFLYKSGDRFLYILRALNDAAIVWREGIAEANDPSIALDAKQEKWAKLSAQTGTTLAEIF